MLLMVYWFNVRVGLSAISESPVFQNPAVQRATELYSRYRGLKCVACKDKLWAAKNRLYPTPCMLIRDQRRRSVPLLMGVVVLRHGVSGS